MVLSTLNSSPPRLRLIIRPATYHLLFNSGTLITFDKAFRLVNFIFCGQYYSRALDGTIKKKGWSEPGSPFGRNVNTLTNEKNIRFRRHLEKIIRISEDEKIQVVVQEIPKGNLTEISKNEILAGLLTSLAGYDKDVEWFHRVYEPIGILPPDQYGSVVIQMTTGCPWNRCTYCDFFKGRRFKIRNEAEIDQHMDQIREFFGDGLSLRRNIFLGDANAIVAPTSLLESVLKQARKKFPDQMRSESGASAFGDVTAILAKNEDEFRRLRQAGLKRIYIGAETGSDDLRKFINKPGTKRDLINAVERSKQATLSVGLIFLLGVGGKEQASIHEEETIRALKNLPLDSRDILYFSPFFPEPGSAYERHASEKLIQPMSISEEEAQFGRIKRALQEQFPTSPTIAIYHISEFLY